jgi:trk system potassium uptake protein
VKIILRYLGAVCCISALLRVIPISVALWYSEDLIIHILSLVLSLATGLLLVWGSYKGEKVDSQLNLERGLMLATLSFLVLPALGSISFLPYMGMNPLNAFFEAVSGYTTTGLTLFSSLEDLPKGLLIWRALTQWMGGIGIVMVFIFFFSKLGSYKKTDIEDISENTKRTVTMVQSQGISEKMGGGVRQSVGFILLIYSAYTIAGVLLLFVAGMPFVDALGISFTALSTGGFSMGNTVFTTSAQGTLITILMILGAIPFLAHKYLFQRKWGKFLLSFEKNIFFIVLGFAILIGIAVHPHVSDVVFQLVSAFTTTGFSTTKISLLPPLLIMLVMIGMAHGGCSTSTSGGIKTIRFYYLLRSIPWAVKKLASPRKAVIPLNIHKAQINETQLLSAGIHVFAYALILLTGTVVFMMFGYSFLDSSFQIFSALGTVGLQTLNLLNVNELLKSILIICMIFGRLEIFPLLILIRGVSSVYRKNRL